MTRRQQLEALSKLEILTQDLSEAAFRFREFACTMEALGTELRLVFKDAPVDDEGYFDASLLANADECQAAMVELHMIAAAR